MPEQHWLFCMHFCTQGSGVFESQTQALHAEAVMTDSRRETLTAVWLDCGWSEVDSCSLREAAMLLLLLLLVVVEVWLAAALSGCTALPSAPWCSESR